MDALGQVSVKIAEDKSVATPPESDGTTQEVFDSNQATYHGHGTDSDIIQAGTKAYLNAINRLYASENQSTLGERKVDV
jgi:2-isopropylmalate synthase